MKKSCIVRKTSKSLRIGRSTLQRALQRWEGIEDPNTNSLWSFSGRLPRKDKVLVDALRTLIEKFWQDW
jgi:hypothetical protein